MFTDREGELIFQSPVFSQYIKSQNEYPNAETVSKSVPSIPRVLDLVHA
jgi:hypothetical protein